MEIKHSIGYIVKSLLTIALLFASSSCKDDFEPTSEEADGEDLIKVNLSVTVNELNLKSEATRTAEPSLTKEEATEEEKRIDDLWIFQFDSTNGNALITPIYYKIKSQSELSSLDVMLKENANSTICVVANTADPNWALSDSFKTLDGLKSQQLPNELYPIYESELKSGKNSIPMEGTLQSVDVNGSSTIEVKVTRIYAKLKIWTYELAEDLKLQSIEINNIPHYSRVEPLTDTANPDNAAQYPDGIYWITRSFNTTESEGTDESNSSDEKFYSIYIPENLQGEVEGMTTKSGENIPQKAIVITMQFEYKEIINGEVASKTVKYTMYPGENMTNNFNIRRNNVYRIKVRVNPKSFEDMHTPSSNCFIFAPGTTNSFEPYYRVEKGGGYDIKSYLDADDATGEKVIDRVEIIWQTENAIGDNSDPNNKLVWYDEPSKKIIVKTNQEGNALIAARNNKGEIIWSWHIWITDGDPGNVGNAKIYTTYEWNSDGINNKKRVSGYAIMNRNLGALSDTPEGDKFKTYGMLYQWGRKDPFPPMKKEGPFDYGFYKYDQIEANIHVYDNSHKEISMTTDGYVSDKGELFNTILRKDVGSTKSKGLLYSIHHPTVFISGAKINFPYPDFNKVKDYVERADWLPEGDECLWGAKKITPEMKKYYAYSGWAIYDNYGPDKTIFDPCPSGWRVPPGDLWLGFTSDGKNHVCGNDNTLYAYINIPTNMSPKITLNKLISDRGFWLCLDGWQNKATSWTFFPTQGSRIGDGKPLHGGICGNYHNATTAGKFGTIDRVNILHIHLYPTEKKFNTFETQLVYYNKSVGGPIRCVRDRK